MNKALILGAGIAVGGVASAASAGGELQLDVNSMTVQAKDSADGLGSDVAFGGETHTGSVLFGTDGNTNLNDILIDGTSVGPVPDADWSLTSLTGFINLDNGTVTGGEFEIEITNSDTLDVDTYSAVIVNGTGDVNDEAPGFAIDGLTFMGMFDDAEFGGVDTQQWFDNQPLFGSFTNFAFNPNSGGFDNDANLDVFVAVPLPAGAGLAAAGLLGVGAIRRRKI